MLLDATLLVNSTIEKKRSKEVFQGKIKSKEDIYHGIENFYETFLRLFNGDKLGKLVLQIKK